ncbi:Protein Tob2 [Entomortierella lignicola]|nr:Protein Tob2 [Entomortierella lignicola]
MAHLGNEPWDIQATNLLLDVDHENALEQAYYGPYNTILNLVFPFHEHYMVAPQKISSFKEAVDYLIEYLVLINNRAVMGMEIKRGVDFNYPHKRIEADRQVRDCFYTMRNDINIPIFIMVSAFGRRCCVYRYTRGATRQLSATTPLLVPGGPSMEQWNIDLSTIEGRVALGNVFNEVKTIMLLEISCASDFLCRFLSASTSCTPQIIDDFKKETAALMQAKYTNHWDPQRPHYGNGYRAITSFGGKVDPLLCEAAQKSSLPVETLHQLIPNDLVLWVEPFNVSYRVGDHGTINTVYDGSRGKVSMKSENSPIQQKMPSRAVRLSPASPPFPSRVSYAIPITCPNTKTQLITPSATPSPPAGKLSVVAV